MTDERANYTVESMKRDIQEKLHPDTAVPSEPSISEASIRLYKAVREENVPVEVNSWDLAAVLNALSDALAAHADALDRLAVLPTDTAQPRAWETDQMKGELRQVEQWLWDVAHDEDEDPRAAHLAALTQTVISAYRIRMQDMELHVQAFHAHPEDAEWLSRDDLPKEGIRHNDPREDAPRGPWEAEIKSLLASVIHAARVAGPFDTSRSPFEKGLQNAKLKLWNALNRLKGEGETDG